MKLQNSYIFLDHPFKKAKDKNISETTSNKVIIIDVGESVYSYIKKVFPDISKSKDCESFYKNKYSTTLQIAEKSCNVEFTVNKVVDGTYVDISVDSKTQKQCIDFLEHIQQKLLSSGIRENYIDIISYDAISEYYCNKISAKLNELERNLRKLLFNIYVLNFGKEYYKITKGIDLPKIYERIGSNTGNKKITEIKEEYNTNKEQAKKINRMQQFFYSLEFGDIENILFTPGWTRDDEIKKEKFLDENKDLSELSDIELRNAFDDFTPKSDWKRFFSKKVEIKDAKDVLEQIRNYRNAVAHFRFFYKEDYEKCNRLIRQLNTAIIEAINITEEKDFAEKNTESLRIALLSFSEKIKTLLAPLQDIRDKLLLNFDSIISPKFKAMQDLVSPCVKEIQKNLDPFKLKLPQLDINTNMNFDFPTIVETADEDKKEHPKELNIGDSNTVEDKEKLSEELSIDDNTSDDDKI